MNITKLTEKYISEHPSIKDCVKKKLINYSALSRRILEELNLNQKDFDAVLIACRRYFERIKKAEVLEDKIIKILKKSKLDIKNKVIVIIVEKTVFYKNLLHLEEKARSKTDIFYVIEGSNTITLITLEEFLREIEKTLKTQIIKIHKDLVQITIKSPIEIEITPGVVSYLYSLFAERGINIIETMSCWTDTIFIVKEEDTVKVMEALKF